MTPDKTPHRHFPFIFNAVLIAASMAATWHFGVAVAALTPEAAAADSVSSQTYGPVRQGETLWSIATKYSAASGIGVAQCVNALVAANPEALVTGGQSVKAGAILKVPAVLRGGRSGSIASVNADAVVTNAPAAVPTAPKATASSSTAEPKAAELKPAESGVTDAVEAAPVEDLVRRKRRQGEAAPKVSNPNEVLVVQAPRVMDPIATPVAVVATHFRPDPVYTAGYDAERQLEIYGGKKAVSTPRPLMELGYPLYAGGAFGAGHAWLGEKNLVRPQFLVYGDYRLAYGNNHDAAHKNLLSTRLNLDLDLKLTGTERFHVLMRPLDKKGSFTRIDFDGAPTADGKDEELELNLRPDTAFFEGDLGQIAQGITNRYNGVDLPVAAGLVPLLFQNGVWMDDTITGLAITIPAKNSPTLGISNFDVTFFAGLDEVSTPAVGLNGGQLALHAGQIFGVATFFDWNSGYYEIDYGYLHDDERLGGFDHSYSNLSLAASHRWKNWLSWSARVVHNFGQESAPGFQKTADGTLLLWESSLISHLPYTLVPYFNLFYGDGRPQSLARDAGAGGILKNTGLNFETDGLTGFPKMDDTAANAHGGALGLQYLFALNRQVVVEVAGLNRHGDRKAQGAEYAVGFRFQQPISRQWIVRADAIAGERENGRNFSGVRAELRCKF